MTPNINKGDVVIVDQKYSFEDIEVGEIIAVKKEGVIIIHRVAKKVSFGDSYIYYTKGDANNNMDDFVIKEDMVVGKVSLRIPYIGYPTVWFNGK
jgi:signal peptidase